MKQLTHLVAYNYACMCKKKKKKSMYSIIFFSFSIKNIVFFFLSLQLYAKSCHHLKKNKK